MSVLRTKLSDVSVNISSAWYGVLFLNATGKVALSDIILAIMLGTLFLFLSVSLNHYDD